MSIELKNNRIINFFKERPDMDIESMILKFIDIMETLQENMNKTLNNSNVLEILDNLKQMNSKIDKTEESNNLNKIKETILSRAGRFSRSSSFCWS